MISALCRLPVVLLSSLGLLLFIQGRSAWAGLPPYSCDVMAIGNDPNRYNFEIDLGDGRGSIKIIDGIVYGPSNLDAKTSALHFGFDVPTKKLILSLNFHTSQYNVEGLLSQTIKSSVTYIKFIGDSVSIDLEIDLGSTTRDVPHPISRSLFLGYSKDAPNGEFKFDFPRARARITPRTPDHLNGDRAWYPTLAKSDYEVLARVLE